MRTTMTRADYLDVMDAATREQYALLDAGAVGETRDRAHVLLDALGALHFAITVNNAQPWTQSDE